jgi:hypothetical protein
MLLTIRGSISARQNGHDGDDLLHDRWRHADPVTGIVTVNSQVIDEFLKNATLHCAALNCGAIECSAPDCMLGLHLTASIGLQKCSTAHRQHAKASISALSFANSSFAKLTFLPAI